MASETFGPSALATPANAITIARLLLTPAFLVLVVAQAPSLPTLAAWIVLAGTDGLDGWLARRMGTTRSGAFLDPLADKFLVIGALVALAVAGTFAWVPVLLIAAREVAISAYRSYQGRRGISIPARWWAKVKTVVQEVAVGFALLPVAEREAPWIGETVLWVAVALALVTGAQYLLDGKEARHGASV